jgi:hypothetical protein
MYVPSPSRQCSGPRALAAVPDASPQQLTSQCSILEGNSNVVGGLPASSQRGRSHPSPPHSSTDLIRGACTGRINQGDEDSTVPFSDPPGSLQAIQMVRAHCCGPMHAFPTSLTIPPCASARAAQSEHACAGCGNSGADKKCSRCKGVHYCSVACEKPAGLHACHAVRTPSESPSSPHSESKPILLLPPLTCRPEAALEGAQAPLRSSRHRLLPLRLPGGQGGRPGAHQAGLHKKRA